MFSIWIFEELKIQREVLVQDIIIEWVTPTDCGLGYKLVGQYNLDVQHPCQKMHCNERHSIKVKKYKIV